MGELLDQLTLVRAELSKQEQVRGNKCIKHLLHILLPAIFQHTTSASVRAASGRHNKNEFHYGMLNLPVATPTVAEIIMAGVDIRPVLFKPLKKGQQLPEGVYSFSLPDPPEGGMQNVEHYIDALNRDMVNKFTGPEVPAHASLKARVKLAASHLRYLATRPVDPYSHYFLYYIPSEMSPEEQDFFTHVIKQLQTLYPAVVFINLSTDEDLLCKEYEELQPLPYLL